MFEFGTNVGFDELPLSVNASTGVSISLTLIPKGAGNESSAMVCGRICDNTGKSFTELTVTDTIPSAVPP